MHDILQPTTRYRPEIDGLRALAVLPVVLFHASLGCPGGFIGVDIFFVISGFLITGIIQRQLANGTFAMSCFWEKLIRRILPALLLVVIFTIAGAAFSFYPSSFEDFGKELIGQSTLVSNFYFWQQDGYFAAPSEHQALLHTWSLAVEEQFYFIFPFLLIFLYRRSHNNRNTALPYITAILTTSLTWCCLGVYKYPSASFFLLPSRAWEMMLGAAIALYKPKRVWNHKLNEVICWSSLATIIYCICSYDSTITFPGITVIPPCLAAAALIFCNQNRLTTPAKILSLRPIVFIGKISYSFYLWHWPIIVFMNVTAINSLSASFSWSLVFLSGLLAYLSWRFVETPFRTNTSISQKQVFRVFYASTAAFTLCGLVIYKGDGWEQRFTPEVIELAQAGDEYIRVAKLKHTDTGIELPTIPLSSKSKKDTTLPILLWGDSHATYTVPAIEKLCEKNCVNIYVAAQAGVPPILGTSRRVRSDMEEYNDSVFEFIKQKQIKDVILVARWSIYPIGDDKKAPSLIDSSLTNLSPQEAFASRLPETVNRLKELGVHVWILKQIPLQEKDAPRVAANAKRFGYDISNEGVDLSLHIKRHNFVNSIIDRTVDEQVTILDPVNFFLSREKVCLLSIDGKPLYRDQNHLSKYGAQRLSSIFVPCFEQRSQPK